MRKTKQQQVYQTNKKIFERDQRLKEVGFDSRFEGLKRGSIDNDLGKVIPEGGGVWIEGLLG